MPAYQVYLNDEQKNYLLKYMHDRRSENIKILLYTAVIFIYKFLLLNSDVVLENSFEIKCAIVYHSIIIVMSGFVFITTFISGFGKTFGYKCDIQCIEKDLYTLDYADFGYREKDTGKPPYYICDNRGDVYICPRFLDYRNADTGGHFLYIKLDNGRGYAIADD